MIPDQTPRILRTIATEVGAAPGQVQAAGLPRSWQMSAPSMQAAVSAAALSCAAA